LSSFQRSTAIQQLILPQNKTVGFGTMQI